MVRLRLLSEASRHVAASPEAVWAMWLDLPARPLWHPRLEWARLHGPPAHGVTGQWKPRGARPVEVEITDLVPLRRMVVRGVHGLPVAFGHYEHHLAPGPDGGSVVTHRMSLSGPLAGPIGRLFGRPLGAFATPGALDALAAAIRDSGPRRPI